jgi:serine/threonine protein kinase
MEELVIPSVGGDERPSQASGADASGRTPVKSKSLSLLERRNARNNKDSVEVESLEIQARSPAVQVGNPAVPFVNKSPAQPEARPKVNVPAQQNMEIEKVAQTFPVQTMVPFYVVDKLIGSGSSSTVHRAHDVNTGLHVALKQFTRNSDDEEVLQFIREEFDILRKFHHSNIVKPIRLEEDYANASQVRVVMILEYGGSMTLTGYVQRHKALHEDACRGLFLQLCSAIFYLHCKKYVHRDIKPDNIVLSSPMDKDPDSTLASKRSASVLSLKMIDFNTATSFGSSSNQMPIWLSPPVTTQEMADLVQSITDKRKLNVDYSLLLTPTGTGLYQAGEVVTGHDYTEKVDIWSAGMTALYMIRGPDVTRPQGRIRSYIRICGKSMSNLSPECVDILDQMLQPNPVARASALQCYCHKWFSVDISRSKRKGRLQNYRVSPSTVAPPAAEPDKKSRSRSRKKSVASKGLRSHSAPPCPTARLQLMRFEALAMHQTYVVKMDKGKGSHQELMASLSQSIIAYGPQGPESEPRNSKEMANDLARSPSGGSNSKEGNPHNTANWRAKQKQGQLEIVSEDKKPPPKQHSWRCCRRRSAKVAIQSPTAADVVIDVAEEEKMSEALDKVSIQVSGVVPSANGEKSELERSASTELPRIMVDRKMSFQKNLFDDKTSRVSGDSRRSKNSRASRNTQLTGDSKKYIQTCSWMFRDETDGFAIRLPEGTGHGFFEKAQLTLNMSDIAAGMTDNPNEAPSEHDEVASSRSRGNGPGIQVRHIEARSETSVSLVAGSETTGSRTAASTAATNLMTNQGLKELFRMIWSARGFRRKYSRECHF